MKRIKLIFGLALCLGLLCSIGTLEKSSVANVGWGIAKMCHSGEVTTGLSETAFAGMEGYAGAEYGAEIGCLGGPAGMVIGGCVGWL